MYAPTLYNPGYPVGGRVSGHLGSALLYLLFVALPVLIQQYAHIQQSSDFLNNFPEVISVDNKTYDFIIVGGGSSGAVVANRLSDPANNYRVLLLEAGGDPSWASYIPALDHLMAHNPSMDWMYRSEPQKKSCASCLDYEVIYAQGKGLGGTSQLDLMLATRGNKADFDEWADLTGDENWNGKNVYKAYKNLEHYNASYPNGALHGCNGDVIIETSPYAPYIRTFWDAVEEYSLKERDVNDDQSNTFMRAESIIHNGERWSTYTAFIKPILDRPNLTVQRYSTVHKLVFDPQAPLKVVGVEYVRHGVGPKYAFASKEVILAAGTFGSPKILLMSGIGPRDDLEKLYIPVRKDLPVGKHFQDQPSTVFSIVFNKSKTSTMYERDYDANSLYQYEAPTRKGPLAGTNVLAFGYYSTPNNPEPSHPNTAALILHSGISKYNDKIFPKFLHMTPQEIKIFQRPSVGRDGHQVILSLVKPRSVGYIRLNDTHHVHRPLVIQPEYFTDEYDADFEDLVDAMEYFVNFYENTESFKRIGAHLAPVPESFPCHGLPFKSKEFYRCYVKEITLSMLNLGGTCKMGKHGDETAVTDSRLKVRGVEYLRVIDGSIMPKIPNGYVNFPIIMIGEKGAEIVLEDWDGVHPRKGYANAGEYDQVEEYCKPKYPVEGSTSSTYEIPHLESFLPKY